MINLLMLERLDSRSIRLFLDKGVGIRPGIFLFAAFLGTRCALSIAGEALQDSQLELDRHLVEAVAKSDDRLARTLLERGADANARIGDQGSPVLFAAVARNSPQLVELLVKYGADYTSTYSVEGLSEATPLAFSICRARAYRVALKLLELGAKAPDASGRCSILASVIYAATMIQDDPSKHRVLVDLFDALLQRGVDVNFRDHFSTPLGQAIHGNSTEFVDALLGAGADPNHAIKQTGKDQLEVPLGLLVRLRISDANKREHMARSLLTAGADPNAVSSGKSILDTAVLKGDMSLIELLLEYGADPNQGDAISLSMLSDKSVLMLSLLVRNGSNLDVCIGDRRTTPLFQAIEYGDIDLVKYILDSGADACLRDSRGNTARDIAVSLGKQEYLEYLPRCDRGNDQKKFCR